MHLPALQHIEKPVMIANNNLDLQLKSNSNLRNKMKLTKATTVLFSMLPKVFSESVSLRIQENGEETGGIPLDWIQEAHSNPCLWFLPEDIGSVGIEGCTDALGNATFGFDGDFTFHTGPLQMKGSGSGESLSQLSYSAIFYAYECYCS